MTDAIHLHPTAALAPRVLLPGDPGRALLLAQSLLSEPKMFNHNRGLWGYTGTAADGEPLTVQSTGMGGPSAAIVIAELADLGATHLIRVGTCGALDPSLALGELLIADSAISADGASRALGAEEEVRASGTLVRALQDAAGTGAITAKVATTDLFYDPRPDQERKWADAGARAVDMETATLFAMGRLRRLEVGALLLVSDTLVPERTRITLEELRLGEERLGQVAARALAPGNA